MKYKQINSYWYRVNIHGQPISLGYDTKQKCWANTHWKFEPIEGGE